MTLCICQIKILQWFWQKASYRESWSLIYLLLFLISLLNMQLKINLVECDLRNNVKFCVVHHYHYFSSFLVLVLCDLCDSINFTFHYLLMFMQFLFLYLFSKLFSFIDTNPSDYLLNSKCFSGTHFFVGPPTLMLPWLRQHYLTGTRRWQTEVKHELEHI